MGPTSSGKSEVAIKLAQKFNGEIISADSRQVYREMNIGTGKVEPDLLGEIPQKFSRGKFYAGSPYMSGGIAHYLIDVANPKTEYNVAKFKKDTEKIIKDILKRKKLPIICGGTGFWIKAIVDNVNFPEVKPDKELRKILEKKSVEELFKTLRKLDLERANNIDAKNKVRLIRAIEICKAIGKVPKIIIQSERYDFFQIGINIPKEELHKKIKKRLEKRFEAGMIEEVKELRRQKLSWKKIQSFGLGYYWIPLYLRGKMGKEDLFEKVLGAEKDYAKRQITWFKKDKRIIWLKKYKEIEKEVESFLN